MNRRAAAASSVLFAVTTAACVPSVAPGPLPLRAAPVAKADTGCVATGRTFPHVEISFRLEGVEGNPFAAEVWGIIERPDGPPVRVPAFHDGADVWRVRYTPDRRGVHRAKVATGPAGSERPANAIDLSPESFDV
ncbi:MAG: DUF5060 domain-containing protein, partial [Planctomycetota bacterium]